MEDSNENELSKVEDECKDTRYSTLAVTMEVESLISLMNLFEHLNQGCTSEYIIRTRANMKRSFLALKNTYQQLTRTYHMLEQAYENLYGNEPICPGCHTSMHSF